LSTAADDIPTAPADLRLAVYSDLSFASRDGRPATDESFLLFVLALRPWFSALVVAGRLDPDGPGGAYGVPDGVSFAALPHYAALTRPLEALRGFAGSLRRFWRVLGDVDAVWLLGPHPLAILFGVLAALRRRKVVLGVRQDMPAYMRARHPGNRTLMAAALALEGMWRLLGRAWPVIVVGPDLARRYRGARRLLPATVSLVRAADIATDGCRRTARDGGPFRVLSVGRLDAEKNPLLMADILAELVGRGVDARLTVCGTGPLSDALAARLAELGVADRAELLGHVGLDTTLRDLYRTSDALLHVSWTEGVPQVLLEAFAGGVPAVATAVGGVPEIADGAALLVPPGQAAAAADALARLAADPSLAADLADRARARVRERTLETESGRVARFITEATA
jgi:glycosyltransferase involved in cell wall biosynthesis